MRTRVQPSDRAGFVSDITGLETPIQRLKRHARLPGLVVHVGGGICNYLDNSGKPGPLLLKHLELREVDLITRHLKRQMPGREAIVRMRKRTTQIYPRCP